MRRRNLPKTIRHGLLETSARTLLEQALPPGTGFIDRASVGERFKLPDLHPADLPPPKHERFILRALPSDL